MQTDNEPLIDHAAWRTMSWANAVSVARAARRSVTEPFVSGAAPGTAAAATESADGNQESAVARLLRLIERIVEVCP